MQAKEKRPESGANRPDRKYKQKYFKHPKHSIPQKHFNPKSHPSRRPRKRREDAALLALFGLAFELVPGTTFHRPTRTEGAG